MAGRKNEIAGDNLGSRAFMGGPAKCEELIRDCTGCSRGRFARIGQCAKIFATLRAGQDDDHSRFKLIQRARGIHYFRDIVIVVAQPQFTAGARNVQQMRDQVVQRIETVPTDNRQPESVVGPGRSRRAKCGGLLAQRGEKKQVIEIRGTVRHCREFRPKRRVFSQQKRFDVTTIWPGSPAFREGLS